MADKRNRWRLRNPGLAPATIVGRASHPRIAVKNIPARFAESTRHGFPRDIRRKKAAEKISLKPEIIQEIRKGLRGVVSEPNGTGAVLSKVKTDVAGKTGTAQAPPGQSHSWFTGFFPYKEPKFAITVFLENGGPGYNSCVIAKEILEKMFEQGLI